jgi:hypothetical protein
LASLDKLEGGLAELVGVAAVVVIGVIVYGFYKGNPAGVAASLLKKLWNALDSLFSGTLDRLTATPGATFGSGVGKVYTGSNLYNPNDDGSSVDAYQEGF